MEAEGKPGDASALFQQAWAEATTDLEKFTAAHYVARQQKKVADKLAWDETALQFALQIEDDSMKAHYPSLYLNIAKCWEDLYDTANALKNYRLALSFADFLQDDRYGNMIKSGIAKGIERVSRLQFRH